MKNGEKCLKNSQKGKKKQKKGVTNCKTVESGEKQSKTVKNCENLWRNIKKYPKSAQNK